MKQRFLTWLAMQFQPQLAALIVAEVERQLARQALDKTLPIRKRYIGQ